jgi:hypothetical protein
MLEDTGKLSMLLGVSLIALSLIGIFVVYQLIKSKSVSDSGLDKLIELGKWFMVSVAIVLSTAIVNDGFRERDQDVKEMQVFDKYTTVVLEADGVEKRKLLTEYFASVSPDGRIKKAWERYKSVVEAQVVEYREQQAKLQSLSEKTAQGTATTAEKAQRDVLATTVSVINQSLASPSMIKPRVYFHIRTEAQRAQAVSLIKGLGARADVYVPGIERLDRGPKTTELRFFRKAEEQEARQIAEAITTLGTPAAATYVQGYEGSTTIRQRHYELWIADPSNP